MLSSMTLSIWQRVALAGNLSCSVHLFYSFNFSLLPSSHGFSLLCLLISPLSVFLLLFTVSFSFLTHFFSPVSLPPFSLSSIFLSLLFPPVLFPGFAQGLGILEKCWKTKGSFQGLKSIGKIVLVTWVLQKSLNFQKQSVAHKKKICSMMSREKWKKKN